MAREPNEPTIIDELGLKTPAQAAHFMGMGLSTLREAIRQGRGPKYSRFGKRLYFEKADLRDWFKRRLDDKGRNRL